VTPSTKGLDEKFYFHWLNRRPVSCTGLASTELMLRKRW
jgi:hypothetical protein